MEILWYAKAPRADIYSQFVSALRTTAGCVKLRSRRAGPMCPAAKYALLPAGHAGPALQGAVVAWGGQGRSPLHVLCGTSGTPSPTHLVIASQSAPRSKCPWGTDWRGNPFPHKGKDGFPRQCERWLGMTARRCRTDGTSYPKGICSAALHCRTPSPTKSQGVRRMGRRGRRPLRNRKECAAKRADRCPPFTFHIIIYDSAQRHDAL